MARNRTGHGFTALRIEGGIIPAEYLETVRQLAAPSQSNADYGIERTLNLRDEISRFWRIATERWAGFKERRDRGDLNAATITIEDWLNPLLHRVLEFEDIAQRRERVVGTRHFPIGHEAYGQAVPLVLVPHDCSLDKADPRFGEEGRRRAPHNLLQEYLNAEDAALWGIVSNGRQMRLARDNPSLTRPAYIEADFERMFEEQLYSDFAAFWLLFHASRLAPKDGNVASCVLETWRNASLETGERARENLRHGVTQALRDLGTGFLRHPANEALRQALQNGDLETEAYFQELLRLVYRLLFLFTGEERGLLFTPGSPEEARNIYREGYAVSRLREMALQRRTHDRHLDLWVGLRVTFGALAEGAEPLGLPALGGLFATEQCPHLDAADLTNTELLAAIRALAFFPSGKSLARVNFRDMGTEELGSVYESLLELQPRIEAGTWTFGFAGDDAEASGKGSARKLSGSYYTPPSLVNELIRSALVPVIERTVAEHPDDPIAALLNLKIVDPACGSGHFLLAAARRLAAEIARLEAGADTPEESRRQHALREVVQHCIFGVDLNPMAVELCRTALWIETVEPGRPLSFLDHHLQCGNSLIGATPALLKKGIPDEAFSAIEGDDKKVVREFKQKNREQREFGLMSLIPEDDEPWERLGNLADAMFRLDTGPEDTLEEVREKERRYAEMVLSTHYLNARFWADMWCAAFFWKKTREFSFPITQEVFKRVERNPHEVPHWMREEVQRLAIEHRYFHWHLAFPEVFRMPNEGEAADNEETGWRGGFDVVLGNPPWERIKIQEQEWFANRSESVTGASNAAVRRRAIAALESSDPALFEAFKDALRGAEAQSHFLRHSERFPLCGRGDINTYTVFAELKRGLKGPQGRAGMIVPTGIANDDTTKVFFGAITSGRELASLFSFENEEFIFPSVHHSYRFCLLTLCGSLSSEQSPEFAFFLRQATQIRRNERRFTLSPENIARINPNTRTCPVFRSQADAELTRKIYGRVPVLIDESRGDEGNPWGIRFMAMFHMANDSGLFRTAAQLGERGASREGASWVLEDGTVWVPLYEAKMISSYDHRAGTYEGRGDDRGFTALPTPSIEKHCDPHYLVEPFYWVECTHIDSKLADKKWRNAWMFGWKDITNNTNERTIISGIVPKVGAGHTLPLCFPSPKHKHSVPAFVGNWNSLVLDYVARQNVGGTHLSYMYLNQFPILSPSAYTEADQAFIAPRVLELTYTAHDLDDFARDMGHEGPPFPWDEERRAWLRAELDACYARLYGLTRDELRYILDPADIYGPDYPSETFRVLKNREMKEYGEYRTARLVLQAWDEQEGGNRA